MAMKNTDLEKAVAESGFPLQLGVEHLVRSKGGRWRVILSEHPWHDSATDEDKFVDLVLQADPGLTLIVECKRAKETELIFLREQGAKENRNRLITRSWVTSLRTNGACPVNEWTDVPYIPGSPLAEFCVIRKNNQRSQELLERTAAELVRATEAIALQELTIHKRQRTRLSRIYTPLIVTTAKIIICDLTLENFAPVTGEIPEGDFEIVPFVRFRKTLSAAGNVEKMADLGDLAKQSERSVLVVHSASFVEILNKLDVGNIAGLANELWGTQ